MPVTEYESNYFAQGLRMMAIGDYEEAVAMFDSALRLGLGDLAEIHVCRGEALACLGAWSAAEESIDKALQMQPYLATAYHARGDIRRLQGRIDEAINDLTTAIHIEPDYDEAYFSRGLACEERHRYAEAEADLTRALLLNPDIGRAYEVRGRVRAAQFKYDQAIEDIRHYLRSGVAREVDNHSEIQGYLITLRVKRLLWSFLTRWRGGAG